MASNSFNQALSILMQILARRCWKAAADSTKTVKCGRLRWKFFGGWCWWSYSCTNSFALIARLNPFHSTHTHIIHTSLIFLLLLISLTQTQFRWMKNFMPYKIKNDAVKGEYSHFQSSFLPCLFAFKINTYFWIEWMSFTINRLKKLKTLLARGK